MVRVLAWGVALIAVLAVGAVASGSAVWYLLGFGDRLIIEGRAAPIEGAAPVQLGDGWPSYGGDAGGARYSAATQITRDNVRDLEPAWTYRTRAFEGREAVIGRTAFEATPILAEGRLHLCSPFNDAIAIDPETGAELWRFDAQIDAGMRPANQFVCRGVAFWRDPAAADPASPCAARIFMATNDARLIALDAATGRRCADFGADGEVSSPSSIDLRWPGEHQITSPPAIVNDVVIIGSAISDNVRVDAPRGTVRAFDARNGTELWSFDPIPRDASDPASATWGPGSTASVGHSNVWSVMSTDPERGWVILPTSSPSPDFFGGLRPGDNRHANSVVALDARSGALIWSFQTVHHDVWDYDLPSQPGLYSVWKDGRRHDVVAQTTKTGLVFVLDRQSGAPFLPVEERPTPQDPAPGETLSATQPFPTATPPIVPAGLKPSDAFGITGFDKAACSELIRRARSEGLFTPITVRTGDHLGTIVRPFTGGGANWGGSAFDPSRNLMIVNMSNLAQMISLVPSDEIEAVAEVLHDAEIGPQDGAPYAMTREILVSPLGLPCAPPPWGVLAAINLESGEIVWRRPIGSTRNVAPAGIDLPLGTPNLGGPMVTAGGVVFLTATFDSYLRAFDVETGEELWKTDLPASSQATPMTYEWKGRQYVVVAAGGYGSFPSPMGDYVVAYALPE